MLNNISFLALFLFLTYCFASNPPQTSLYLFSLSTPLCYICAIRTKQFMDAVTLLIYALICTANLDI